MLTVSITHAYALTSIGIIFHFLVGSSPELQRCGSHVTSFYGVVRPCRSKKISYGLFFPCENWIINSLESWQESPFNKFEIWAWARSKWIPTKKHWLLKRRLVKWVCTWLMVACVGLSIWLIHEKNIKCYMENQIVIIVWYRT